MADSDHCHLSDSCAQLASTAHSTMPDIVDLPAPQALAKLASAATQMLYGVPIEYGGPCLVDMPGVSDGHTAVVPLIGAPTYIVSAKANGDGGYALASIMFDCQIEAVDDAMVEDSLRELVNILAGQLKSLIAPTHQMGLPSRLTDDMTLVGSDQFAGARIFIRNAHAEIDIGITVFAALNFDS
jgi:CheY-specific phosphatase CheX